jgi:hypothetical protein
MSGSWKARECWRRAQGPGVLTAALLTAAPLIAGCDPFPVPDDHNRAEVHVDVLSSGDATIQAFLGRTDEEELRRLGEELAAALFPVHQREVRLHDNWGGYPFVEASARDVIRTESDATIRLDGGSLRRQLTANGFTDAELVICRPHGTGRADIATDPAADRISRSRCAVWPRLLTQAGDPWISVTPPPAAVRRLLIWSQLALLTAAVLAVAVAMVLLATGWRRSGQNTALPIILISGALAVLIASLFLEPAWEADRPAGALLVATTSRPWLLLATFIALMAGFAIARRRWR